MKKKWIPENYLNDGASILSTYLRPLGFKFEFLGTGNGSGGEYAFGHFIKIGRFFSKTKRIELHFRGSLGFVTYFNGDLEISHTDYIDLVDKHGQNKYPNFSENPLDAFHCLLWDLQNLLNDFTENNAKVFRQKSSQIKKQQQLLEQARTKDYSGDQNLIKQARIEFRKGNYKEVDKLKHQIKHPELLSDTEKKLFELNDKRK